MPTAAAIRRAQPADARAIAEVHVASWKSAYGGLLPAEKLAQLDVGERERMWRQRLEADDPELRTWVASLEERVVGFAFTQPSSDDDLGPEVHELTGLYLEASAWGKGIGTILVTTAEAELRRVGITKLTLWVLEDNEPAKRFYAARGWSFDKRDPSFKVFGAPALRYRKTP